MYAPIAPPKYPIGPKSIPLKTADPPIDAKHSGERLPPCKHIIKFLNRKIEMHIRRQIID